MFAFLAAFLDLDLLGWELKGATGAGARIVVAACDYIHKGFHSFWVEAEKRGKGKKGKKKKKGGGSGGAGPSQEAEAPSEAAAAKPAKLDREGLIRLLETLHEERIRAKADAD
ncbi:hypothetical protein EMIHUDRAFT_205851 [Emiliania huxleyi CCMP1516]|uniref:Uncharacterized protein n=2 Tax=Emiliania huxleyi TaxID=2903 RepID=A0A0D3JQG3_EMIH1|nr:hypothetical protein EMIHUDRAFT_205851 [Emiliania huxleyi CCMP1516]EOD25748.1 hypothetical protein EMIHUDRAFT_205851 [Emiliania huxleyi CCMP1516]|eukprot:XP_005778177.1 hypothetical protein EMIHUDRAFT_205851 [Emiliania huxleyi CCMP1516]